MLDSESEDIEAQSKVKVPDPEELVKRELVEHPEILEAVEERKKRKFTRSGLIVMLVGVSLIASGLVIHSGDYSIRGFIVGVGVIVVIIGTCRFLIGLIKPIVPSQL
jgi:hypothetical protein